MEKSYWKTDKTTDTKLDKLQIALEVVDIKGDNDSTEEEKDEQTVYSGCFPLYFTFLS